MQSIQLVNNMIFRRRENTNIKYIYIDMKPGWFEVCESESMRMVQKGTPEVSTCQS